MIRINLLPTKAELKKQSAIFQLVLGAAMVFASLLVCFFINQNMEGKVEKKKIEISDLNDKINKLKSVIAEVEQFKEKRRDLEAKIQTIKELNDKRSGPVKLMEEFTVVLPHKAWVSTYRENAKQLSLEGLAVDGPTVSDFVDNLKNSKFFYNVQLIQVQKASDSGRDLQRFSITCMVNYITG